MDLQVPLNPELEAQLREHAAASGKDVVSYVVEALREKLESEPQPARRLSTVEWGRWLDEFVASHADVRHTADDSRESIYGDRGA